MVMGGRLTVVCLPHLHGDLYRGTIIHTPGAFQPGLFNGGYTPIQCHYHTYAPHDYAAHCLIAIDAFCSSVLSSCVRPPPGTATALCMAPLHLYLPYTYHSTYYTLPTNIPTSFSSIPLPFHDTTVPCHTLPSIPPCSYSFFIASDNILPYSCCTTTTSSTRKATHNARRWGRRGFSQTARRQR